MTIDERVFSYDEDSNFIVWEGMAVDCDEPDNVVALLNEQYKEIQELKKKLESMRSARQSLVDCEASL